MPRPNQNLVSDPKPTDTMDLALVLWLKASLAEDPCGLCGIKYREHPEGGHRWVDDPEHAIRS